MRATERPVHDARTDCQSWDVAQDDYLKLPGTDLRHGGGSLRISVNIGLLVSDVKDLLVFCGPEADRSLRES
jgi:hypothetical protein